MNERGPSILESGWNGVLAVCATYVFFLIFAQFGFLELVRKTQPDASLDTVLMVMGIAGLLASILAARLLKTLPAFLLLGWGFAGCGLTALLALSMAGPSSPYLLAALTGLSLGLLTVSLAVDLPRLCGPDRFGLKVGIGTGTAYLICNLPWVFAGTPRFQALLAAVGCALGLIASMAAQGKKRKEVRNFTEYGDSTPFSGLGFLILLCCFLALIWLDSALFFIIQQTADLKGPTWGAAPRTLLNGLVHLVAAMLAGTLIDRARLRGILLGALSMLALGALDLQLGWGPLALAGPLYVTGVSLYSTVLVCFPSLWPDGKGVLPQRWRAGLVFGVAGWLGSALGIGMARDLHRIPPWFLFVAAVPPAMAFFLGTGRARSQKKWALGLVGLPLVWLFLGEAMVSIHRDSPPPVTTPAQRGRQVYIQEGCIHCHSQYVRPDTTDVTGWGPVMEAESVQEQTPPLFGNRRQGPDLLNVGNRRGAQWQRLHLMAPRKISPGSTMPSYAYLFQDGRGDDLLAYLLQLGGSTMGERFTTVETWRPDPLVPPLSKTDAQRLFARGCAQCHGENGRGDGELSNQLPNRPRNLVEEPFRFVPAHGRQDLGLARVIKFGIPGTNMPGHEYYSDREVKGLVWYVTWLRNGHGEEPTGATTQNQVQARVHPSASF